MFFFLRWNCFIMSSIKCMIHTLVVWCFSDHHIHVSCMDWGSGKNFQGFILMRSFHVTAFKRCWKCYAFKAKVSLNIPCFYTNLILFLRDNYESTVFLGYTLMHPSLTRPYLMTEPPLHTDIIHYENIPGFSAVRQNILG